MKDKFKKILFILMLFIPMVVFAEEEDEFFNMSIPMALGMEAFVTIHMSVFVLIPLSNLLSRGNSKGLFWILFLARIAVLVYCDFYVSTAIATVDFFAVFAGAFVIVPILSAITKKDPYGSLNSYSKFEKMMEKEKKNLASFNGVERRCARCYMLVNAFDKKCPKCGYELNENNVMIIDKNRK